MEKKNYRKMKFALVLPLMIACSLRVCAIELIGSDPILTASIGVATAQARKTLLAQDAALASLHVDYEFLRADLEKINYFQRQYDKYLSQFKDVLSYAAQLYGFYHEIDGIVNRLDEFTQIVSDNPENAIAVALSTGKNNVYRQIIKDGVGIIEDFRQVLSAKTKMTEVERVQLVLNIRPKLKELHKHLARMNKAVKYTTMLDVWYEISGRMRPAADNAEIALRCMSRWNSQFKKNI